MQDMHICEKKRIWSFLVLYTWASSWFVQFAKKVKQLHKLYFAIEKMTYVVISLLFDWFKNRWVVIHFMSRVTDYGYCVLITWFHCCRILQQQKFRQYTCNRLWATILFCFLVIFCLLRFFITSEVDVLIKQPRKENLSLNKRTYCLSEWLLYYFCGWKHENSCN